MRTLASIFLVVCTALVLSSADGGEKGKEVTLKGKITCGKCDLGVDKACATVIVTKGKDKKETVYYFDAASHKKYHGEVCTEAKQGEVKGTVTKDGKKNTVAVKELKFK